MLEPYRLRIFEQAFSEDAAGLPRYSRAVQPREEKREELLLRESVQGSDCYVLANDEDQPHDDLLLAIKLVRANPELMRELDIRAKSIERKDGRGSLNVLLLVTYLVRTGRRRR